MTDFTDAPEMNVLYVAYNYEMVLMTTVIVKVNGRVLSSVKASQLRDFM
jgi:hypothetical protein